MLMNNKDITKDFILLDLYKDDITFYFSPSSVFLSAITASVIITLYLNKKIKLDNGAIIILDDDCIKPYNQLMMDYIIDNKMDNVDNLAHELFMDSDFSLELYEMVINELKKDGLIEVVEKQHLILTKNIIKLTDQDSVRESYQKLYSTLFDDNDSQEFVALALIIDTFFMVDDYFDKEDHDKIKEALDRLKQTDIYEDIIVFKDVIDEFYSLIAKRSTNYFGI